MVSVIPHQFDQQLGTLLAGRDDTTKFIMAGVEQGKHKLGLVFVEVFGVARVAAGETAGFEIEQRRGFTPGA